jgi:O-antigen/teichoic acid export membrane protein
MMVVFTKNGSFKLLAGIKIVVSIMVASTQLFFGWLGMGYWGLVYSTIIVQVIAFVFYFVPFLNEFKNCAKECSLAEMRKIMLTNWRLPMIVFPGNFLNNLVQSLPVFFLGKMDSQVLGYYGLARRVIEFPLSFVASAVQRLYVKELTDEIINTGIGRRAFLKNLKIYAFIAALLILGIFTLTKPLLPILFGKEWEPAIPYLMILGVLFSVKFVFGGLSSVMILGRAPKIDIVWQICFALIMAITFITCIYFQIKLINTITAFVFSGILSYVVYGFLSYHVAKSKSLLTI